MRHAQTQRCSNHYTGRSPDLKSSVRWHCAIGVMTLTACAPADPVPPPLPPDEQSAARLLAVAGEGFRIRETDHFTIAYDSPYEIVRPLIGRLEGTYDAVWRFCRGYKLDVEPLGSRLLVLLYDSRDGYARYRANCGFADDSVAGFYSPQSNFAAFLNTLSRPEVEQVTQRIEQMRVELQRLADEPRAGRTVRARREVLRRGISSLSLQRDAIVERFNRLTLQHEVAHQMFFNLGVHVRDGSNPLWLVEGLACQFEVPQTDQSGHPKRINQMRLGDLRNALGVEPGVATCPDTEYHNAVNAKRVVSLGDLISDAELFTRPDANIAFRYAQAWGLVYYLSREHHRALAIYLNRLMARGVGGPVDAGEEIEAFRAAFDPADEQLSRTWIDYMLRLRYNPAAAGR